MKRRFRRQPFILLSFSSSKNLRKAQETQSYQRFQHVGHTDFNTSGTNAPRLLSRVKVGTHSAFGEGSHTRAHTPKQGLFRMGVVSLPSAHSARSRTSPGRVSERQTLPLLRLDPVCSRRTQRAFGTAMRLCASLFRGAAAPLGCVIFLQFGDVAVFSLRAQYFLNVRGEGWYHYPQCALRAAETSGPRLLKRLTCRFLRSCSHQGISPCPLLFPIGAKQECNNLGAGTAIVRFEQPIANAVGDAVLHGPHHRVIAIAAGRLIT